MKLFYELEIEEFASQDNPNYMSMDKAKFEEIRTAVLKLIEILEVNNGISKHLGQKLTYLVKEYSSTVENPSENSPIVGLFKKLSDFVNFQ